MLGLLSTLLVSSILTFSSPVNYPVSLAGNFGEPRPNHFHGGIDVRTGQVEGKPIFSVADGYVSRVTVGLWQCGVCEAPWWNNYRVLPFKKVHSPVGSYCT